MKRVFFISFLFVILQSSSAFCSLSVDDYKQMEIEGKEPTYNEITQDQTSYENWVAYVDAKTDSHYNLPSFSDVAVLTENLLAYSVGNYADVASGVFDNIADTFSLGSDIWDFMTFNVQQMAFDYSPDFVNLMRLGVDDEIYTTTGETYGKFLPLPIESPNGDTLYNMVVSGTESSAQIWAAMGGNSLVLCSFQSSNAKIITHDGNIANYPVSGNYVGTLRNGFYRLQNSNAYLSSIMSFLSQGGHTYIDTIEALQDFFGSESTGDTVLSGGIIVNDNPVINPVSLTSALGYPFKQTVINNYNNNTPIPWRPNNYNYIDYNYGYEVPFWQGQELETLEYPAEIDFPSVEFETIEVDQSVDNALENLNGSWIVEFFLVAILLLILGLIL